MNNTRTIISASFIPLIIEHLEVNTEQLAGVTLCAVGAVINTSTLSTSHCGQNTLDRRGLPCRNVIYLHI